jgi:hypothetical protein
VKGSSAKITPLWWQPIVLRADASRKKKVFKISSSLQNAMYRLEAEVAIALCDSVSQCENRTVFLLAGSGPATLSKLLLPCQIASITCGQAADAITLRYREVRA